MTLHPTENVEHLASRTLAVFLVIGVLLVVFGLSDGNPVNWFVLAGGVVAVSNARELIRRRSRQRH